MSDATKLLGLELFATPDEDPPYRMTLHLKSNVDGHLIELQGPCPADVTDAAVEIASEAGFSIDGL